MRPASMRDDEALARARARFLASVETSRIAVPYPIADSWARSLRAGVDPSGTSSVRGEFDPESPLARCAREPIQRLVGSLGSLNIGVVLADEHARVIGRVDNGNSATSLLNAIDLAPGYDYSEDLVGTNGVGSVTMTRRPIYVSGAAHFQGRFSRYACAGAPILHPITGRLEGVIDLTSDFGDSSPLMQALASQTASAIEHRLIEQVSQLEHDALHAYMETVSGAHSQAGLLVLASAGQMELRNPEAEELLSPESAQQLLSRASEAMGARDAAEFTAVFPDAGGERGLMELRVVASRIVTTEDSHRFSDARDPRTLEYGVLLRAQASEARRVTAPDAGRARPGESDSHDVVDRIDFGVRMLSGTWQLARRDLSLSIKGGQTVLVLGEVGTGKVSLIREIVSRVVPGAVVVALAPEDLRPGESLLAALDRTRLELPGDDARSSDAPDSGIVVILRNADRLPTEVREETRAFLRSPRVGDRRVGVVLTGESLERVDGAGWEALLPYISHAVTLPALRQRRADFPAIVSRVMQALEPGSFDRLSATALRTLTAGHWPGNIHQLTDALRTALEKRPSGVITTADLPDHAFHAALRQLSELERDERNAIITALYRSGGNRTLAAKRLGLSRATLYRKLASYGLTSA